MITIAIIAIVVVVVGVTDRGVVAIKIVNAVVVNTINIVEQPPTSGRSCRGCA